MQHAWKGVFSGAFSPFFGAPAYWLAPVVNLCVSDANKNLLVRLLCGRSRSSRGLLRPP